MILPGSWIYAKTAAAAFTELPAPEKL